MEVTLQELKLFEDALASYDQALRVRPDYTEALYNRGIALQELMRFEEALASFDSALRLSRTMLKRYPIVASPSMR